MDNVVVANVASSVASVASSSPVLSQTVLETIKTWIVYVGAFAAAIVTAYAGIKRALKDLGKESANPGGPAITPAVQSIVGGTILETTTLLMWSESNRAVVEAAEDMKDCIKRNSEVIEEMPERMAEKLDRVINAINYNTEAMRDVAKEMAETRHQVERVRDKLP